MRYNQNFMASMDWDAVCAFLNSQFAVIDGKIQSWLNTHSEWNVERSGSEPFMRAAISLCFKLNLESRPKRGFVTGGSGNLHIRINEDEMDEVATFVGSLASVRDNLKAKRDGYGLAPTELCYEIRVKDYSPFKKK